MKIAITYFLGMMSIASCHDKSATGSPTLPPQTINNVAYGSDPKQKMDVYLPAGRNTTGTKVIVLIHGGAWNQGDKSDFSSQLDTLKKRLPGYAIFNINYRLVSGTANRFPAQEEDTRSAINFIYSKKNEYQISDDYVLLGASAGAHLGLLYAYKNTSPVKVRAVVDFFGPAQLTDLYNSTANPLIPLLLQTVTGGTPLTHAALYAQSSPQDFVTAQSPPTIILHGGVDGVVPFSQSANLKNALQSAGVPHEYVFYPNEDHGWSGVSLTDSYTRIVAFLQEHVD